MYYAKTTAECGKYLQNINYYDLDISKNRISFNVYKRYSDSPLFKINKEIKNKKSEDIYSVLNSQGYIINKSRSLESLINLVNWKKFKLVK